MKTPPLRIRILLAGLAALLAAPLATSPSRTAPAGKGQDAVVLEESLEVDILSDSEAQVRYSERTQVLTQRGVERYGSAWVGYNPSVTIKSLRAAVTPPDGKRREIKKKEFSDVAAFASFELYSDARGKGIHFGGAEPGAILEYSYEESLKGLFYVPTYFGLQEEIPVRHLTYTLRVPASFPLQISVRGAPAYTKEESQGIVTHRWEVKDVPAFREESDAPPEEDLLPRVAIYPGRLSLLGQDINTGSWDGIARWYQDLARDRMVPDPEVAETARKITAGLTDPGEKTRRLYEFLQQKIRYISVSLGIGGWQPHDNGQVLRYGYGDCKDKATLLIAMMSSVGLKAFPVLIRTRDAGLMDKEHPSPKFNHAIAAVPRPGGYLFLDPTAEDTPYGDLPWVDQGVPVLVVKEDGTGEMLETPLTPAEKNRTHRAVTARITPAGSLEGEYSVEFDGSARKEVQEFLQEGKTSEKEDALEREMSRLCPGAQMKGYRVVPAAGPRDPVKVIIQFDLPRYVIRAGDTELITPSLARFPHFADLTSSSSDRRYPAFFQALFADTSEVRLQLPPGRTLKKVPADRKAQGPGLQSTSTYRLVHDAGGETLIVTRSLEVSRREIPPSEFPALRDFLSGLAREDAEAVSLVPESAPASAPH